MRSAYMVLLASVYALSVFGMISCSLEMGDGFTPSNITLTEVGELKELQNDLLVFVDAKGDKWTAPRGTLTDGASVPRLALPITDGRFDGSFLKAAVVHDAYCQSDNETRAPNQYQKRKWQDVHKMFHEAMIAGGTSTSLAGIMFAGVWLGGPRWDEAPGSVRLSEEAVDRALTGLAPMLKEKVLSVQQIESDLRIREPLALRLQVVEDQLQEALKTDNKPQIKLLINQERALIDQAKEKLPNDSMLKVYEGHWLKSSAMLKQREGFTDQANADLLKAKNSFSFVVSRNANDPVALTGLGSVAIAQGELEDAEALLERSLISAPDNPAALRERVLLERARNDG